MTEEERNAQVSYAEKIAKLLRKAEITDNEIEAESLTAKAQALMIKYAITEELLAQAEGRHVQDTIVTDTITYTGIFQRALFDIGYAVVRANNCKGLIHKSGSTRTRLTIVGFKSDVMNVKVLDASLQVQASTAMQRWYRTQDVTGHTPMMKFKLRREFLIAFASGVSAKLAAAKATGIADAVAEESERSGAAADVVQKSTDLVLRTKDERVQDWMDNQYGSSLRTVRRNYSSGGLAARSAGYRAGMNADLGDPRIGGSRREIGG